jgi:prepilin peptidase CpaA
MIPADSTHVAFGAAIAVSAVACVTDLRTRRIPNMLTFGAALAALVFHGLSGGLSGLGSAAAGWIVGIAIFFAPFALGGMGAGDLKLLAALGAWLGPGLAVWLALYTGIAGGVMAIVVAFARGYLRQALSNIWLLLAHWRVSGIGRVDDLTIGRSRGPHLAYALPILAGTLVVVWMH